MLTTGVFIMPKKQTNPTDMVRQELIHRTSEIRIAMAARDKLQTKEDAQVLLSQSKQTIQYGPQKIALNKFAASPCPGLYKNLMRQIDRLNQHIKTLPTKDEFEAQEISQRQEVKTQQRMVNSEIIIRAKVGEFNALISKIEDSGAYKDAADNLKNDLNGIVKQYCEDNVLTKETLPIMMEDIAQVIKESKPTFEPQAWHKVADIALTLLNVFKAVVGSKERIKLFSEQGQEAKELNNIMDELQSDIDTAQYKSSEPCEI